MTTKHIELVRQFKHADGVYPVTYAPGLYAVAEGQPGKGQVSARCAEVACAEGYAVAAEAPAPAGEDPAPAKTKSKGKVAPAEAAEAAPVGDAAADPDADPGN